MKRKQRGLTLAEILVSLFLIGMFGLVAVGSLQMAMRQWGKVAQKVNSAQNARFITSTIANELRMAIPFADPTRGYMKITPAVPPTGVLIPNNNAKTSAQLEFTEPNPAFWRPMQTSWNQSNANNYRDVIYRVQGQDVIRENRPFDGSPNTQEIIASAGQGGSVTLNLTFLGSNMIQVDTTAREGTGANSYTSSYSTRCFIVGK